MDRGSKSTDHVFILHGWVKIAEWHSWLRILSCGRGSDHRGEPFCFTDGAEVLATKVHAIKEAIMDAHLRGLGEYDIYSDSRSAIQALYCLVSRHEAIAEIKELIKTAGVRVHMHWIRENVGHTYHERADALAKAATARHTVDVEVKVTRRQVKKPLFGRVLSGEPVAGEVEQLGKRSSDVRTFPASHTE